MERTSAYQFTVRMIDGKVAPEDQDKLDGLRTVVKLANEAFDLTKYVKLQGRLGEDNPNAWKYKIRRNGGIYGNHQCIRLFDAATADVYVYNRRRWWR
jgi:hypothetical protein